MNLFQPKPITYERFDKRQERLISRWPGQKVCARIVPIPYDKAIDALLRNGFDLDDLED